MLELGRDDLPELVLLDLVSELPERHHGPAIVSPAAGSLVVARGETIRENPHLEADGLRVTRVFWCASSLREQRKAHQVGTMAGADALVTGTIGQLGDQYVVNARAVSVADGTVLASARVNIAASGLITLASDSVVLRTRSDAVFRSMLVPGWGQMYNHQPDKGTFLMAAAVALAAVGVTFAVLGETTERSYNTVTPSNPGPCKGQGAELFPTCVQNLRSTAQSRYLVADGFFAGLGVLYIYNIIDAAASGGPRPSAEGTQVTRLQLGVSADGVSVRGGF